MQTRDCEMVGGDNVADEVREAVVEMVTAGCEHDDVYVAVLIAAGNLIGNRVGSLQNIDETTAAIGRVAMRVHVSLAGGGEA